jgi:hypothetical protein
MNTIQIMKMPSTNWRITNNKSDWLIYELLIGSFQMIEEFESQTSSRRIIGNDDSLVYEDSKESDLDEVFVIFIYFNETRRCTP